MSIKISNPFKGFINAYYPKGQVTQYLYENVELYKAANLGINNGHSGIDIAFPWGTPVYAVSGGLVCEVRDDPSGYGKHVRILSDNEDGKGGLEWTYGHNSFNLVKVGDIVKTGHKIALTGNTGFVVSDVNGLGYWVKGSNKYAGTHLHLGCREFVYDKKGWQYYPNTPKITILNYDNGMHGCIDFKNMFYTEPYLGDMAILKKELEDYAGEPWYMTLIRSLKFFGH